GHVISVPHLRCDRGQVVLATRRRVVAAIHHHATECQMNEVAALVIAPRPFIAEWRHASMDQRRVLPGERVFAEADRIQPYLRRPFEQDVGPGQKRPELLAVRLPLEIEYDRALAAIVLPEEQRAFRVWLVLVERPDAACRVTPRRLDLDHIGAESRQRQPAIFRLLVCRLDYPAARERSRLP